MQKYSRNQERENIRSILKNFQESFFENELPSSFSEAFYYGKDYGNFNPYDEYSKDCCCECCLHISFNLQNLIDFENKNNTIHQQLSEIFFKAYLK